MTKLVSLDAPLKGGTNFSLLNIIPAPEDKYAKYSSTPKSKIQQARRSIEIDQDVVDALRHQFGNMPLGRAIRIMLGLNLKTAQNAWQEEEDALLKEYYPKYGSKALSETLDRKPHCVRDRASKLGIKRVWEYKRDRRGRKR